MEISEEIGRERGGKKVAGVLAAVEFLFSRSNLIIRCRNWTDVHQRESQLKQRDENPLPEDNYDTAT